MHLGLYQDETAKYCHWHVSGTHYLEQWGDTRTFDGTVSFIQPLIAPLYGGHSESELIEFLTNENEATSYELTQRYWQTQHSGMDFKSWWDRSLHDGFVAGSAFAPKAVQCETGDCPPSARPAAGGLEVIFRRDATIYDGRFANNGWLQETPKPMTQICWDNPVLMSVATAKKLKLKSEDEVELELNGRKVKGAIWITPGHPDDAVTVNWAMAVRTPAGLVRDSASADTTAHLECALVCRRAGIARHGQALWAGFSARSPVDGRPGNCAGGDLGRVHQKSRLCARNGRGSAARGSRFTSHTSTRNTNGAWRST